MIKYKSIANEILQQIEKQQYTHKLPTEEQLVLQYNASRNTIRNSLSFLAKEGYIYSIQGSGNFVRPKIKKDAIPLNQTEGITSTLLTHDVHSTLLEFKIIRADKQLANSLQCNIDTPLYYIKRIRYFDNTPFAIETAYYNSEIIPHINKDIASKSIFEYIRSTLNLTIGFTDKYLKGEKLSKENAALLNLNEGDPSVVVNDNMYLSNGTLFNISKIVYHYQHAEFYTSNIR